MIAALFVQAGGAYFNLPDVDPWDEKRDARLYAGPWPVVAHPPCSRWCQMARVNETRYGHKVGDDKGCFASALSSVRRWGGVLEHPAETIAWKRFGLSRPPRLGWQYDHLKEEWVCEVAQSAYGHRARKLTWLLYRGSTPPPSLIWEKPAGTAWVSFMSNHRTKGLPRLSKKEASATPVGFRDILIGLARDSQNKEAA